MIREPLIRGYSTLRKRRFDAGRRSSRVEEAISYRPVRCTAGISGYIPVIAG